MALALAGVVVLVVVLSLSNHDSKSEKEALLPAAGLVRSEDEGGVEMQPRTGEALEHAGAESSLDGQRSAVTGLMGWTGSVRDEDGHGVAGALVTWTSSTLATQGAYRSVVPAASLIELSEAAETDLQGVFVLPQESREEQGVVWVTADGFRAAWLWAPADAGASSALDFDLVRSGAQDVTVIRRDGGAVEGARVFQRGSLGRALPSGLLGHEQLAQQLFARMMVAPADGHLEFSTWSAARVYSAEREATCSADVVAAGEPVTLELEDTVVASGVVRTAGPDGSVEGALLYIYLEDEQADSERLAFVRAVPASGRFEGMRWPWNPGGGYRLAVEGNGLVLGEARIPPTRAGAAVQFEVICGDAHPVTLHFATEGEAPGELEDVPGVYSWVSWLDEQLGTYRDADIQFVSDEQGLSVVTNCPSGSVAFKYEAEGYVPGVLGPMLGEEEPAGPLEIKLEPAGRLEVLVTHAGEAVDTFTVYYWPQGTDPASATARPLQAGADHVAVLDDIPLGEFAILAKASGLPQCQPEVVALQEGRVSEVALELPTGAAGIGRVLDGATREPVAGAEVYVTVGQAGAAFAYSDDVAEVAQDGRFRIASFPPSISSIVVFAPGYSPLASLADIGPEGVLDFGTLFMARVQPLVIRCRSRAPIAWEQCFGSISGAAFAPDAPLSADGTFTCEQGQHGQVTFQLVLPSGEVVEHDWSLSGAGPWERELALEGTASLTVRLVGEGSSPPANLELKRSLGEGVDTYMTSYLSLEEGASAAQFEALDAGNYSLTGYDSDWSALATRSVEVEAAEPTEIELRLDGQPFAIRIIDPQGTPIVGAIVELRDVENPTSQLESYATDSGGVAHFAPTVVPVFMVNVSHPTGGFRPPVQLSQPRTPEPVDIIWESSAGLVVDVLDGETPLEGLEVWVHEQQSGVPAANFSVPASGRCERPNIGAGNYFAEHHSVWVWNQRVPFVLDDKGTPTRLEFRRLGGLTIRVTDPYGGVAAGMPVELTSDEFGGSVADWLADGRMTSDTGLVTNPDGEVRLEGLPHGSFSWSAGGQAGQVTVPTESVAELEVQLVE